MKTLPITLGTATYDMPPVPMITIAELQEQGIEMSGLGANSIEGIKTLAKFVHASLLRTYPDVSYEAVLNNIDMHNMGELTGAFVQLNKLEAKVSASGEASAG